MSTRTLLPPLISIRITPKFLSGFPPEMFPLNLSPFYSVFTLRVLSKISTGVLLSISSWVYFRGFEEIWSAIYKEIQQGFSTSSYARFSDYSLSHFCMGSFKNTSTAYATISSKGLFHYHQGFLMKFPMYFIQRDSTLFFSGISPIILEKKLLRIP